MAATRKADPEARLVPTAVTPAKAGAQGRRRSSRTVGALHLWDPRVRGGDTEKRRGPEVQAA